MPHHDTAQLIAIVARRVQALEGRILEFTGLGPGQLAVLEKVVACPGITNAGLCEQLRVKPATVSRAVRRLEIARFVRRAPRTRDGRTRALYPTSAAGAVVVVARGGESMSDLLLRGLGAEDRTRLDRLFGRILANLMEIEEQYR